MADTSKAMTTPQELRAPVGAVMMEIDWADGETSLLPHQTLRAYCPCAHCQGHEGPIRWFEEGESLGAEGTRIEGIEEVGSYAIKITWGDDHQTGIYSFRHLRELGGLYGGDDEALRGAEFGR